MSRWSPILLLVVAASQSSEASQGWPGTPLPDGVLRKIYYQNALRHLPSLRSSIERQLAARQNRAGE